MLNVRNLGFAGCTPIRYQNTEAEQGYPTLAENHKDINVKYRAFLHEAANVVLTCEDGGKDSVPKSSDENKCNTIT